MTNEFLESCVRDLGRNAALLRQNGQDPSSTSVLLSFPRSGNGWVRQVLASFFSVFEDEYFDATDLDGLSAVPLYDKLGLRTAGLARKGDERRILPLDLYVPDVYLYARVKQAVDRCGDGLMVPDAPKKIFKSHHISDQPEQFCSVGLLVRNPLYSVPSATLLLENGILERPANEIRAAIEYYLERYIDFMDAYLELVKASNVYVIDMDAPRIGLSEWLHGANIGKTRSYPEVERAVSAILEAMPHRSGFKKEILEVVDLDSLQGFSKAKTLFDRLTAFSDPRKA